MKFESDPLTLVFIRSLHKIQFHLRGGHYTVCTFFSNWLAIPTTFTRYVVYKLNVIYQVQTVQLRNLTFRIPRFKMFPASSTPVILHVPFDKIIRNEKYNEKLGRKSFLSSQFCLLSQTSALLQLAVRN